MASSKLYPGEIVISDDTPEHHHAPPDGYGTGLDLSLKGEEGYAGVAQPFPDSLLIPRSEWQPRIQEMEETKSRVSDLVNMAGLPPKDQARTNFCWGNAIVAMLEWIRAIQNEPRVSLSPASVCAQITGYRNVGGWGRQAIEFIIEHGVVPVDEWPANAIDSQYATPQAKQTALLYRFANWYVVDGSNIDQIMSCLLRRWPIGAGLNWWSHEVPFADPVWLDGAPAVRIRNSWGPDWPSQGAGGWSVLQGRRMYPDDAVAAAVALAA